MTSEIGVDEVFPEDEDVEEDIQPQPSSPGKYMCRYCPAGPFANAQRRVRHERKEHPVEHGQAKETRQLDKATGGIPSNTLSERAKEFAEAVDAAAPDLRNATRKQLIQAFENESDELIRDATELENFLDDYGLTLHQIRQVKRTILGRRGGLGSSQGAGQQVMAFNPQTGQNVPIIVLGQQGGQTPPATPSIIMTGGGEKGEASPGLTRADVKELIEEILEKSQNTESPQVLPNMRMYQEPMLNNESGEPMRDSKGQIIMRLVQEPIDPFSNALSVLKETGLLNREAPMAAPTADEIAARIKSTVEESQPKGPDPAIVELQRSFDTFRHQIGQDDAVRDAIEKTTATLVDRFAPQLEELSSLKGQQGLSDHQAEMINNRDLSRDMISSLEGFRDGLRTDLQPLVFQMAASNLKQMNFSESTIAEILRRDPVAQSAPIEIGKRRAASTMRQWIKEA